MPNDDEDTHWLPNNNNNLSSLDYDRMEEEEVQKHNMSTSIVLAQQSILLPGTAQEAHQHHLLSMLRCNVKIQ